MIRIYCSKFHSLTLIVSTLLSINMEIKEFIKLRTLFSPNLPMYFSVATPKEEEKILRFGGSCQESAPGPHTICLGSLNLYYQISILWAMNFALTFEFQRKCWCRQSFVIFLTARWKINGSLMTSRNSILCCFFTRQGHHWWAACNKCNLLPNCI